MKRNTFLFFFYLTLASSFGTLGTSFTLVLLGGLGIAHMLQQYLFGWRHFPADLAVAETGSEDIYYRGNYIPTNIGAQKEKRFLQSVYGTESPMAAKIAIFLLCGFLVYAGRRIGGVEWTVGTFFEIAAVISVIPIAAFSQYLLPLFLSAAGVLFSRHETEFWPFVSAVVYGISFCLTCAAHAFEEKRIGDKPSAAWIPVLKNAARAAAVFAAIYTSVDIFLPTHRPMSDGAVYMAADKVNHLAIQKMFSQRRGGTPRSQQDSGAPTQSSGSSTGAGGSFPNLLKPPAGSNSVPHLDPGKITFDPSQKISLPRPEFAGKVHDSGNDQSLPSGTGSGDDAQLKAPAIARGLDPHLYDGGKKTITQADIEKERTQVKEAAHDLSQQATRDPAKENLQLPRFEGEEKVNSGSRTGAENGGGTTEASANSGGNSGADSGSDTNPASHPTNPGSNPGNPQIPPAKADTPPSPVLSEATLMALVSVLKFIFAALLVWLVYAYFTRSSKKKVSDDKNPRLSREQRLQLAAEIKNLADLHLRNREGIIRGYQIFLKVMAAAQLPKEDFLPPTDYAIRLRKTWPRFDESFSIINEVFSDAFYGESPVAELRVSQYESALKRIMSAVVG